MATILVVDDRPTDRQLLTTLLGYKGHRLLEAAGGERALALVRGERPDLVISDLLMPAMDGYEFLRQLRADPATAATPVIFYTARFHSGEARALAEAARVSCLAKPAEPDDILRAVDQALGTTTTAAPLPEGFDREHLRLLTDELARRVEELEEAHRRKDEFLAMLSHELRNPLAAIEAAVWALERVGARDPQETRLRSVIARQAEQLARLVDGLLDVARLTRGVIELCKEPLELAGVLARAVENVRPLIETRRHRLDVSLPSGRVLLEADPVRLEQIFANLLDNAARYTPPGGRIALTAGREGGEVVVSVRDSGRGMPAELVARVFDLFVQGERSLDRQEGGLGIGLTQVKRLVELHGGRVEAASAGPGRGSTFTVRLPVVVTAPAAGQSAAAPAGRPRRVLVVDDHRDTAESLAMLVEMLGHEVRVTYEGEAALAEARARPPDVVLLDIGMPGMDGYEVARRLREQAAPRPTLVAVTGYGRDEDRRRSRDAGFDLHLVKPVDLADLERVLGAAPVAAGR